MKNTQVFSIPAVKKLHVEVDKDIYGLVEINMVFPEPDTGKLVIKRRRE